MAYRNVEQDIRRAQEMRNLAKGVKDASAKSDIEAAADRLDKRAAKKARKVGKPRKRRSNVGTRLT